MTESTKKPRAVRNARPPYRAERRNKARALKLMWRLIPLHEVAVSAKTKAMMRLP